MSNIEEMEICNAQTADVQTADILFHYGIVCRVHFR